MNNTGIKKYVFPFTQDELTIEMWWKILKDSLRYGSVLRAIFQVLMSCWELVEVYYKSLLQEWNIAELVANSNFGDMMNGGYNRMR
jgi:hypothetical protein